MATIYYDLNLHVNLPVEKIKINGFFDFQYIRTNCIKIETSKIPYKFLRKNNHLIKYSINMNKMSIEEIAKLTDDMIKKYKKNG